MPYDISVTRDAFKTKGGYYAISFIDGTAVIIFIAELAFLSIVESTIFGAGLIFYFLVNKRYCEFKTSDIRVSFVLVATAEINRISYLTFYALSGSTGYSFLVSSVADTGTNGFVYNLSNIKESQKCYQSYIYY